MGRMRLLLAIGVALLLGIGAAVGAGIGPASAVQNEVCEPDPENVSRTVETDKCNETLNESDNVTAGLDNESDQFELTPGDLAEFVFQELTEDTVCDFTNAIDGGDT